MTFVVVFEAGIVYHLLIGMPRQYFRGDGKFRDKYELTFSHEGITVKTPKIDSKLAWSLYTKVIEGRQMYLLIYGKETRMMTAVPKRAFTDNNQENRFRELVTQHISDHPVMERIPTGESDYTPTSFTPPDWR
jgi:hypothetical protein